MIPVELAEQEWQAVLQFMAFAPARDVIPLLNKIGSQLQAHHMRQAMDTTAKLNGKETGDEQHR